MLVIIVPLFIAFAFLSKATIPTPSSAKILIVADFSLIATLLGVATKPALPISITLIIPLFLDVGPSIGGKSSGSGIGFSTLTCSIFGLTGGTIFVFVLVFTVGEDVAEGELLLLPPPPPLPHAVTMEARIPINRYFLLYILMLIYPPNF